MPPMSVIVSNFLPNGNGLFKKKTSNIKNYSIPKLSVSSHDRNCFPEHEVVACVLFNNNNDTSNMCVRV